MNDPAGARRMCPGRAPTLNHNPTSEGNRVNENETDQNAQAAAVPQADDTQPIEHIRVIDERDEGRIFRVARTIVEQQGGALTNEAGRVVLKRYDEMDRALGERLGELVSERQTRRRVENELSAVRDRLETVEDVAAERLKRIRRLRAERDSLIGRPTPADLYRDGGTPDEGDGASPFDTPFSGPFVPDGLARAISEKLDALFAQGGLDDDEPCPVHGENCPPLGGRADEVPPFVREMARDLFGVEEGEQLVRVAPGVVAVLGQAGPCDDPACTACRMVGEARERAQDRLSGPLSDAKHPGHAEPGAKLTGAQVADLRPGTRFRIVEMGGNPIQPFVLPLMRVIMGKVFPGAADSSPVTALLDDHGMPVPDPKTERPERAGFEKYLKMLDARGARYAVVG